MNPETVAEHLYEISGTLGGVVEKLEAIHDETKKTNGRVTAHDGKLAEHNDDIGKLAKIVSLLHGEYERRAAMDGVRNKGWREFGVRWLERGIVAVITLLVWFLSENAGAAKALLMSL